MINVFWGATVPKGLYSLKDDIHLEMNADVSFECRQDISTNIYWKVWRPPIHDVIKDKIYDELR
jgi:hypothetical protein